MKIKTFLTCLMGSYFLTFLLLLLLAFGMYRFHWSEKIIAVGIAVIYALSCFVGAFLYGRKARRRKYLWGMLLGIGYYVVLLGITWKMKGKFDGDIQQMVMTFVLCIGGGMTGGMIA